jgi:hypothetical protein
LKKKKNNNIKLHKIKTSPDNSGDFFLPSNHCQSYILKIILKKKKKTLKKVLSIQNVTIHLNSESNQSKQIKLNTMEKIIYKGIEITFENGWYIFYINEVKHTNTNIHMAKRMITRTLNFLKSL